MSRVACYLRCSTTDQSTDMQKTDLLKYCELHNLDPVFFEDQASGRSTKKRPDFNRMLEGVRNGDFSHVIVWKMDRFARNLADFLQLHAEIERYGAKFVSFKDHLDFSTPVGRMIAQILGVFAEFESAMISTRVKAGMTEAKRKGKKFGAKPMDFPLEKALDLKSKGLTYSEIAKSLGVGRTTVGKYLRGVSSGARH